MLQQKLLDTVSKEEKKRLIARHLDYMYATIMRQAHFTIFEKDAHEAISNGATIKTISDIYHKNLREQFGDAVQITEEFSKRCGI